MLMWLWCETRRAHYLSPSQKTWEARMSGWRGNESVGAFPVPGLLGPGPQSYHSATGRRSCAPRVPTGDRWTGLEDTERPLHSSMDTPLTAQALTQGHRTAGSSAQTREDTWERTGVNREGDDNRLSLGRAALVLFFCGLFCLFNKFTCKRNLLLKKSPKPHTTNSKKSLVPTSSPSPYSSEGGHNVLDHPSTQRWLLRGIWSHQVQYESPWEKLVRPMEPDGLFHLVGYRFGPETTIVPLHTKSKLRVNPAHGNSVPKKLEGNRHLRNF